VKAATRRAELLLATGGDPRRELDLDGRAVAAIAEDLDEPDARDRSRTRSPGSPPTRRVGGGERRAGAAAAQPDLAWRSYAGALLAEAIGED
jgi:hypothetical protein